MRTYINYNSLFSIIISTWLLLILTACNNNECTGVNNATVNTNWAKKFIDSLSHVCNVYTMKKYLSVQSNLPKKELFSKCIDNILIDTNFTGDSIEVKKGLFFWLDHGGLAYLVIGGGENTDLIHLVESYINNYSYYLNKKQEWIYYILKNEIKSLEQTFVFTILSTNHNKDILNVNMKRYSPIKRSFAVFK